jgi:flavone/flavonol reductase
MVIMKLLGLSCGRKMGNSEILLKEALMAAEEFGMEVEIIRLADFKIKPCTGCTKCTQSLLRGGYGKCVIEDDDMPFIHEKIMDCDGLIVSVPVYILSPTGYFKVLCDRLGPSHDVAMFTEAKNTMGGKGFDERYFKTRVGGFIGVGGSPRQAWVSLGLPLMHCMTFPLQIGIVDQLQVLGAGMAGQVVLNEEAIKRARKLGRNMASAMGKPIAEVEFMGDEPGTCPVCHTNLLLVGKKNRVECAICGIQGLLSVDGDEVTVIFDEEEQKKSHLTLEGRRHHFYELNEVIKKFEQRKSEVSKKLERYKAYNPCSNSIPPGVSEGILTDE